MTGILKIVTAITGVLAVGEALALLVGMVGLSPRPNAWITPINMLWIGLDVLCGAGLVAIVFTSFGNLSMGRTWLIGIALLSLASHFFRDWEYFASQAAGRYLINTPLLAINNLKLLGFIAVIILSLAR